MKRSWPAMIVAFVLALIGIVLAIGGGWLVVLGGSIYYFIAGIALLASAWFLFKGRLLGGWIYVGLFILSAIWGFAESRGNAWAMVPWLVAPLVLLIAVLLVMPTLTRAGTGGNSPAAASRFGLVFVVASFAMLGIERRQCRRRASGAKLARNDRPVAAWPRAPTGRPMAGPRPPGAIRR